jgi:predicted amidohydrolase
MNLRRLSVIALSNRDYPSLKEKIAEAVSWLELASRQGSELAVLPECLNRFRGDGGPLLQTPDQYAFDDWRKEVAPLLEAAVRLKLWVIVPVVHRQPAGVFNSFFLISPDGQPVWQYDKVSPSPVELKAGVIPGQPSFYEWQGIKLGGAICFDSCFPENLDVWAKEGVQLGIFASLWPGGSQLNNYCKLHSSRVAVAYPAWSRIIDIDGLEVVEGGYRQETLRFGFGAPVYTATLNFDRLSLYGNYNQERIVEILQRYGSRVKVTYDQGNCLWFLESCDPELSEKEIQREYQLVTASEYFRDCAARIQEHRR